MSINFEDALKAKQLRDYFHEKGRIYIVVDATSDDVVVPDFLKGDPALRLVLNTRMPQPIYIRDSFVESNFTFSGVSHQCVIPLSYIWAAYVPEQDLESGLMWESNIPETVRMVLQAVDGLQENEPEPLMHVVEDTPTASEKDKDKPKKPRKVGHLRVIK
jgi:stringent starvation protein B